MAEREITVAGHFGEWLQGRAGAGGPVVLVTLQPAGLRLRARHRAGAGDVPEIAGDAPVSAGRAGALLATLGLHLGGTVGFEMPFAPGLGTGMSTAALVALARLAGFSGPPETLARACIAAEGASDPLMFPTPDRLLWASREGRAVATLAAPPPVYLLGGVFGPPRPTDAADADYDDISDLVAAWGRRDDAAWCAALASESAARCLARRGPAGDPVPELARDLRALGWATAHSGAVQALIFPPDAPPRHGAEALAEAGVTQVCDFAPQKETA
ncbi:MAG: propanediol utilization protein [Rubellimicrobium sp.]|nr:propanediol utilization protein [Rubellimicrobium sp.]